MAKAKMDNATRVQNMLRAAELFCHGKDGKAIPQYQIAQMLGVEPSQVTRWIQEAKLSGYIKVFYLPPGVKKLEAEFRTAFDFLRHIVVIPTVGSLPVVRELAGRVLAGYFDQHVQDGMTVAVSGGNVLYQMAMSLPDSQRAIDLYPAAIIGRGPALNHIDPGALVSFIWAKCGGRLTLAEPVRSPARIGARAHNVTVYPYGPPTQALNAEQAALRIRRSASRLRRLPLVTEVLDGARQADVLFASCGPLRHKPEYEKYSFHSTLKMLEHVGITENWLKKQGAAGDICYTLFDTSGNGNEAFEFFAGFGIEDIRSMAADPNRQVIVAALQDTEEALDALLEGKLCNVLVTDEQTASRVLAIKRGKQKGRTT